MKKIFIIVLIIIIIALLAVVGIFIYERAHVSFHSEENGMSVSIIGGADGPTSIFLAGKVGGDSNVDEEVEQGIDAMQIEIQIGDKTMLANLENNDTTQELVELLGTGELVMSATNYGGFEKVCSIGKTITRADKQITTRPGDIMLYSGNQMVIFYDSNSWSYTPIGHIDATPKELEAFLSGSESEVTVRLAR
ncbi:MAG: hypothetical protein MJ110_00555 [Lachnospiraceae bacterium]|nr:hypothetical protein [Lachnospiraceae bacterium]